MRQKKDIGEGLIRFSVGLEDTADLLADFEQALQGEFICPLAGLAGFVAYLLRKIRHLCL